MFFSWRRRTVFWAVVFIFVGAIIWLGNLGMFDFRWNRDWPILLLIVGLYLLIKAIPGRKRRTSKQKGNIGNILSRLQKGEITAEEAAEEMEG